MEILIVLSMFAALVGGPATLTLIFFLGVVTPYGLAFHLTARLFEIKERKLYRSMSCSFFALISPALLISVYGKLGGTWILVGICGSLVMNILFIKGIYRTTYFKSIFCYLISYVFLFMGMFILFITAIGLGISTGGEELQELSRLLFNQMFCV